MPTFCRHNRFIERCPICSRTLPGNEPAAPPAGRARSGSSATRRSGEAGVRRGRGEKLRVRREGRAVEDGYRSELLPGLRASADAERLARELAFSSDRLAALAADPPGAYGRAHEAAVAGDLERATWVCFLAAYLCPTEQGDPFAAIDAVLEISPLPAAQPERLEGGEGSQPQQLGELLDSLTLGPRSSHRPGSGAQALLAYSEWARRTGGEGGQAAAFIGDPSWDPGRRFARLFERLALPGLDRAARYELLISLGRLGLYELQPSSLYLSSSRSAGAEDAATLGAKRVFGIGDPLLLDRRAVTLAEACSVALGALDLGLANWSSPERATYGFRPSVEPDATAMAATLGL